MHLQPWRIAFIMYEQNSLLSWNLTTNISPMFGVSIPYFTSCLLFLQKSSKLFQSASHCRWNQVKLACIDRPMSISNAHAMTKHHGHWNEGSKHIKIYSMIPDICTIMIGNIIIYTFIYLSTKCCEVAVAASWRAWLVDWVSSALYVTLPCLLSQWARVFAPNVQYCILYIYGFAFSSWYNILLI